MHSGRVAWEKFTNDLAVEVNDMCFPECLLGLWYKHRGYCARLALMVHCLRVAAGEIKKENVDGENFS